MNDLGDILQIALIATVFVALLGSICWISVATYRSVKRIDNQKLAPSEDLQAQLAQLQQSIDSIAIEVERIAEAQRFVARLEAERDSRQALPLQS
jgi:cell division protein FtsB